MLEKWKKAVIHLECATDSENPQSSFERINQLSDDLRAGKLSLEDFGREMLKGSRDVRSQGTALFISHNSKRYLLTARHVLHDTISAERRFQEEVKVSKSWSDPAYILKSAEVTKQNTIYSIIFRVPSINEIKYYVGSKFPEFLMNLAAGTQYTLPYSFSSDVDLAIISLDREMSFLEELLNLGYEPISSADISGEPTEEGSKVFTVGFPAATSVILKISQDPALTNWSSSYRSIPVFAFGRVAMLHEELPFYWVDMSIYPGNSGGPVIEENKLVGIISGQATLSIDSNPDLVTRIPFGEIIKAKYIWDLIQAQEKKDEKYSM